MSQFRNTWQKKFVFCLMIFLILFAWADFGLAKKCAGDQECGPGLRCVNNECVRALEIKYPKIGAEGLTEEVVAKEGLPGYVKYILTLAIALIGLIIFAALIYNGILYLTSAGRPEQMSEARNGILYAFLGGLILLASGIIFNTINPQLMITELPKVKILEQVVVPGVYICNYKIDEAKIKEALEGYTTKTGKEQIEAAEKLREIIWNPQTKQGCPVVNFSGNFQNFQVTAAGNTIFVVPAISIDPNTGARTLKYEYGIVLHEKDNFGGQCYLLEPEENKAYGPIKNYSAQGMNFTARSVTLFQKPSVEPVGDGVTLYECFNYNREGKCTENDPPLTKNFLPEGENDFKKITPADLDKLKENTLSISFSPPGSYFALLYEGGNFDKRCQVLHKNNPNLTDFPIGSCKCEKGAWYTLWLVKTRQCIPCLNSIIVIKGSVL